MIQDNSFKQADEESYLVLIVKSRIRKDKSEPGNKHKSRNSSSHESEDNLQMMAEMQV